MKIDTKPLGIGKGFVEVIGSWGQQDMADDLMIALYETDANQNDPIKGLKANKEMRKKAMEFFKSVFALTDEQCQKIMTDVSGNVLNIYISYVCGLIEGGNEQSFKEFNDSLKPIEKENEDPKKEQRKPEK